MYIYLLYILICMLLAMAANIFSSIKPSSTKAANNFICFVALVVIVFIAGIRDYSVGADTKTYLSALNYYSSFPQGQILDLPLVWPYDFEPGFFLFTKLCAFFQLSDTAFLFVVAVAIYVPVFLLIKDYSSDMFLSVVVYFGIGLFAYSLGIFRQMIALSICLVGLRFLLNGNNLLFTIFVLIAAAFHTSALMFGLLWFYNKFPLKLVAKWSIPISFICLLFGREIALLIVRFFPMYSTYIGSADDIRGGTYVMYALLILLMLLSIRLISCFENRGNRISEIIKLSIWALCLALCVQAVSYSMGLMGRSLGYYTVFLIILVPELIKQLFGKHGSILALYAFVPIFLVLGLSSLVSFPYATII